MNGHVRYAHDGIIVFVARFACDRFHLQVLQDDKRSHGPKELVHAGRCMQREARHARILYGQTESGQAANTLPARTRHKNVFEPGQFGFVFVRQTLCALATIEQISRLVGEQIETGRRAGRTAAENLNVYGARNVTGRFLFDAKTLLLGFGNVWLISWHFDEQFF